MRCAVCVFLILCCFQKTLNSFEWQNRRQSQFFSLAAFFKVGSRWRDTWRLSEWVRVYLHADLQQTSQCAVFTRLRDRGWYRALFNTPSFREHFHYTVICISCNVKDRAALLLALGYSWLDLNLVFRSTAASPPPSSSSSEFTAAQWFTWQWNVPGYECVYNYSNYRLKYQLKGSQSIKMASSVFYDPLTAVSESPFSPRNPNCVITHFLHANSLFSFSLSKLIKAKKSKPQLVTYRKKHTLLNTHLWLLRQMSHKHLLTHDIMMPTIRHDCWRLQNFLSCYYGNSNISEQVHLYKPVIWSCTAGRAALIGH